MNNNKKILGDISAIKQKGLDFYNKNYFWPIDDDTYNKFINSIHDKYIDLLIKNKNEVIYDIMLIDYSFLVVHLEGIFHYNAIKNISKKNKFDIISGKESKNFREPDWESFRTYYRKTQSPYNSYIRFIRRVLKRFIFNKHLSLFKFFRNFISIKKIIGIGSFNILKKEFIEKNDYFCEHYEQADLIPQIKIKQNTYNNEISNQILIEILNPWFVHIKEEFSNFIDNIDIEKIKSVWLDRLNDVLYIYKKIIENKKNKYTEKLLVTQMAKPLSKLLIISYQRLGCDVYGFHHGNDLGLKIYNIQHQSGRAHASKFIVPTNGILKAFQKNYGNHIIETKSKTRFYSVNSSYYKKNNIISNNINFNTKKKIMIMGTPANNNRYVHEFGQFFYFKIYLEFCIIKLLKNNGHYVIYKVHPDRKKEISGLFENLVDEYIIEPFENSWSKGDIYVFTDTGSSTFGFSLSTNRQIILLDNENDNINKDVKEMISKRIDIVNSYLDKEMKIKFNNELFLQLINKSDKYKDNTFFDIMLK